MLVCSYFFDKNEVSLTIASNFKIDKLRVNIYLLYATSIAEIIDADDMKCLLMLSWNFSEVSIFNLEKNTMHF